MHKALVYCRVSTEEQAQEGYSLEAQERYCRHFGKNNAYKIAAVYRDEGKSGTTLDRPALKDLLARVQQDKSVGVVIVQEIDRLARNTSDHLTIRALLQKAGVKLISVAQPMLDDSPEGRMVDTIIASVNQFQSDINSRKTKKGLQERFNAGWWPGMPPLGYTNGTSRSGQRVVIPDLRRWHLLRDGFKMYLTGSYSAIEIADILYKKGLKSRTGKRICNSIMTKILRNPFYASLMRWNGEERTGKHKPMISLADHKRVSEIIEEHNLHASRRRRHRFLLLGFVFCNLCGGRHTAESHERKRIAYYHCHFGGKRGKEKEHTNQGQNVTVEDLGAVVQELRQRQDAPDPGEAARLEREIERWRRLFVMGEIDEERYKQETRSVRRRLAEIDQPRQVLDVERAVHYLKDVGKLWLESTKRQREFVREIFARIVIEGQQVASITPKPAYAPMFVLDRRERFGGEMATVGGVNWLPGQVSEQHYYTTLIKRQDEKLLSVPSLVLTANGGIGLG